MANDLVYRGLDVETVRSEYQPALHVPSLQAVMDDWAARALAARERLPVSRHRYGDHDDEWYWYLPAPAAGAPLLAFLHGGYWRRLSADDGLILAQAAHGHGFAFASVNYTLCPNGPLSLLIDQSRRAASHLVDRAADLGHGAVHVAGHSAGAHLAAMASLDEHRLAGLVLVSGVYDITPIVHTPINDDVRMTPAEAAEWSPAGRCPTLPGTGCIVAWGSLETAEFARQGSEWAQEWTSRSGNRPATVHVAAGRNHFDVIDDLLAAGRPLGDAVIASLAG